MSDIGKAAPAVDRTGLFFSALRLEQFLPWGLCGLLLVVIGGPVLSVIVSSFRTGLPGQESPLTLVNYVEVFSHLETYKAIVNTFLFAVITLAVTCVFAVPIVWLMNRTDLPLKGLFFILMGLGILIPVFLKVMGWVLLASPRIGLLNTLATTLFGLEKPLFNIYTISWMGFLQGVSFVPLAFFMLSAAYQAMDPALEEAAYTGGVSKLNTLLRIDVPITTPALLGVIIYVTMLSISVFEVPALLGLPGRIFLLSSRIYYSVSPQAGLPNYGLAGAYGAILLFSGLIFSYVYTRMLRKSRRYIVITGRGYRPRLLELGRWKPIALAFMLFYFVLELFLPAAALLWSSLLPYFQAPSMEALSQVSLDHYRNIRDFAPILPFVNTALLMLLVPTVTLLVSILVSWVVVRTQSRLRGFLDTLAFLPHATPHILLAVAMSFLALTYRDLIPIYNTIWIIVAAHIVTYIAYGTRTMNGAMIQIHHELEEAGRISGAPTVIIMRKIVLPLIRPAIVNAWLWVMLLSHREVTMALTLRGPGNEVVSTHVWQLWSNGSVTQVAALGVLIILFMALIISLLTFVVGWKVTGREGFPS